MLDNSVCTELLEISNNIIQSKSLDISSDLITIYLDTNQKTAAAVYSFLNVLFSDDSKLSNLLQDKECAKILNRIKDRANILVSAELKKALPLKDINLDILKTSNTKPNKTILNKLRDLVFETLIRQSKHDIQNNINLFFKVDNVTKSRFDENHTSSLLEYLRLVGTDEQNKILQELAFNLEENDIRMVLDFFEKNPKNFDIFLLSLNYINEILFKSALTTIYNNKKYFTKSIISSLPIIDLDQILPNIREYNWEILAALIDKRPEIIPDICQNFHESKLSISKRFFLERRVEQDDSFSYYISDLKLSLNELLELSNQSNNIAENFFQMIDKEEDMIEFCGILSKKNQDYLIEFIQKNESNANLIPFINNLTKLMRFSGKLKDFIVSKYSHKEEYFHCLISYLDIEDIEELLLRYYTKTFSINCLLRKFYPQELIIKINKFKNFNLSKNLISDCIENNNFDDKDWMLALKFLESTNSQTKFFMCFLIIKEKPNHFSQKINKYSCFL